MKSINVAFDLFKAEKSEETNQPTKSEPTSPEPAHTEPSKTDEVLKEAVSIAPKSLQKILSNGSAKDKFVGLLRKNNIPPDKENMLFIEIIMAFLCISDLDRLDDNIVKYIGVSPSDAVTITNHAIDIFYKPMEDELNAEILELYDERRVLIIQKEENDDDNTVLLDANIALLGVQIESYSEIPLRINALYRKRKNAGQEQA